MGLRDVSGIFSREFVVGYFAPAFFIVIVVAYSFDWVPQRFAGAGGSDQILLVGGVALLVALVCSTDCSTRSHRSTPERARPT